LARYYHVFKNKLYILLFLLLSFCLETRAQYDVSFNHYWMMESGFNPAAAGKEDKINVVAAYNLSFAGFENNPRTMYVSGDMPFYALKSFHGVGVSLINDQIGLFTHQRLAFEYAYKKNLLGGKFSVGVMGSLINESFDGSELDLEDASDPAFSTSEINGNAFDLGAGIYYMHKNWYAGFSVMHAMAPLVEMGETNEIQIDRTYYLTGGYNIKLRNPFLKIQTSVLGRTDGVAYRADITGRLVYSNDGKMMYAGLGCSPTNSFTVYLGGNFHGITLGYCYEVYTSAISMANGSHELIASYQMDLDFGKRGKNKHKSVRIL